MRVLRIAALAVLVAGAAVALWLYLGAPGISGDAYYAAANARQALPFAGVVAAAGLLVFVAGGTARSRGRWAARGLWLLLIGVAVVCGGLIGEMAIPASHAHNYVEYKGDSVWLFGLVTLLMLPGLVSLVAGIALWLLSYRLDRVR